MFLCRLVPSTPRLTSPLLPLLRQLLLLLLRQLLLLLLSQPLLLSQLMVGTLLEHTS